MMEKEIIVKWKIQEFHTAAVLALLPALVEATRNEKGNLFYSIYQSETDINELILHERYANAEAMDAHKSSAHYQEIVLAKIIPFLSSREVSVVNKLY